MVNHEDQNWVRPDMLKVLCVLTFIWSGISTFSYLMISLSYRDVMDYLDTATLPFEGMELVFSFGQGFFVAGFVLNALSFLGALLMWKGRKMGFHLYLAAQLVMLITPGLFGSEWVIPWFDMIVTAVFVGGYALNLKFLYA